MHWLETKYTNLISTKLPRFKLVNGHYNCRCPLCGDSQKNKLKARGWVLFKPSGVRYHCFNCGVTLPFFKFLKTVDPNLFDQYQLERLQELSSTKELKPKSDLEIFVEKMKPPKFKSQTVLKDLKKISQLDPNHKAKNFISSRRIPARYHHKIYYCPKFWQLLHTIDPERYVVPKYDEARIIFPLLKEDTLVGFQGRTLAASHDVKYITIMLDPNEQKLFIPDEIDINKPIFAFEGPIDSYFIPNSIAACGGSITSLLEKTDLPKANIIIVYDNEPRNNHTVKKMKSAIDTGYNVCFWPDTILQKDVNDMILSDLTPEYIENTILTNTAKDLEAKLKFVSWKRI